MPELISNLVQVHPYRWRGDALQFLILQRSLEESLAPGMWQVITGGIEPAESSITAAKRELMEETGFDALVWVALPDPAMFYFEPTDKIVLSPVFGCEINTESEVVLSEEHSTSLWLAADSACAQLAFPSHRQGVLSLHAFLRDAEPV